MYFFGLALLYFIAAVLILDARTPARLGSESASYTMSPFLPMKIYSIAYGCHFIVCSNGIKRAAGCGRRRSIGAYYVSGCKVLRGKLFEELLNMASHERDASKYIFASERESRTDLFGSSRIKGAN